MNYRNKRFVKKPRRRTPNKRIINGQTIDAKSDSQKYRIMKGIGTMSQNRAASFQDTPNESLSALNLIESIGCSIVDNPPSMANFSLIDAQTDDETLTNPNISGSQNPKIHKKLDTTKSFPNVDDPFYEIDVGRDEGEREKKATNRRLEAGTKTSRLASDIARVNIDRNYDSTLKQFKSQTSYNGSRPRPRTHNK